MSVLWKHQNSKQLSKTSSCTRCRR